MSNFNVALKCPAGPQNGNGTRHGGANKSYKGNETEERGELEASRKATVSVVCPLTAVPVCGDALQPEHQRHYHRDQLFQTDRQEIMHC